MIANFPALCLIDMSWPVIDEPHHEVEVDQHPDSQRFTQHVDCRAVEDPRFHRFATELRQRDNGADSVDTREFPQTCKCLYLRIPPKKLQTSTDYPTILIIFWDLCPMTAVAKPASEGCDAIGLWTCTARRGYLSVSVRSCNRIPWSDMVLCIHL